MATTNTVTITAGGAPALPAPTLVSRGDVVGFGEMLPPGDIYTDGQGNLVTDVTGNILSESLL